VLLDRVCGSIIEGACKNVVLCKDCPWKLSYLLLWKTLVGTNNAEVAIFPVIYMAEF
jgi:hypothetical protein